MRRKKYFSPSMVTVAPWLDAEPVIRPEASRKLVCAVPPVLAWLVEVPTILPDALRITERVMLSVRWVSIVCTIRPEASRTVLRQDPAKEIELRIMDRPSMGRIAFISAMTESAMKAFDKNC
jgi:hypothetical protein